jgi:cysteine desulfurase / selenocysteine lyase
MERLGLAGTSRASLGIYNDERDIDALAAALEAGREMFAR